MKQLRILQEEKDKSDTFATKLAEMQGKSRKLKIKSNATNLSNEWIKYNRHLKRTENDTLIILNNLVQTAKLPDLLYSENTQDRYKEKILRQLHLAKEVRKLWKRAGSSQNRDKINEIKQTHLDVRENLMIALGELEDEESTLQKDVNSILSEDTKSLLKNNFETNNSYWNTVMSWDIKESEILQKTSSDDAELIKSIQEMISQYKKAVQFLDERNNLEIGVLNEQEIMANDEFQNLNQGSGRYFVHFYIMCFEYQAKRDLFHKYIYIVLPSLSYTMRQSYMEVLWKLSTLKKKRRALEYSYLNERSLVAAKTRDLLFKQVENTLARREREIKQTKLKLERERLQQELNECRKVFEEKKKIRDQEKLEEERALKSMEEKKNTLFKKHAERAKTLAEEFKEQKKQAQQKLVEKKQALQKEIETQQKTIIKINKPKVEKRNDEAVKKLSYLYSIKTVKKDEVEKKAQQMKEAIERLPDRPNVERDSNRVIQETETRLIKKTIKYDKADKIELFRNPGFTEDGLMKDIRYKISSALSAAGLINTPYANQLLNALSYN